MKPETEAALARIARRHAERYHAGSNSKTVYSLALFERAMNDMLFDAYLTGTPRSFRGLLQAEFKCGLIELVCATLHRERRHGRRA